MTIAQARPAPAAEALLADGRVVRLRTLRPEDRDAVQALHARACDESVRLRFFSVRRDLAGTYAEHLTTATDHHLAMVAVAGETVEENMGMLDVLRHVGFRLTTQHEGGVAQVTVDLEPGGVGTVGAVAVDAAVRCGQPPADWIDPVADEAARVL